MHFFAMHIVWKEIRILHGIITNLSVNVCNIHQDSCLFLHLRSWTAGKPNKKTCHEKNKDENDCQSNKMNIRVQV